MVFVNVYTRKLVDVDKTTPYDCKGETPEKYGSVLATILSSVQPPKQGIEGPV